VSEPRIFWLNGLAGIGKSTVAQTIAEQCDQQGHLGANFFFSRQDDERSNPHRVFSTIAYQLAGSSPSFRTAIALAAEANKDPADTTIAIQLRDFIITPLQNIADPPRRLVVVVDALDECRNEDGSVQAILRLLATELGRVPFPLKFLITSRPEHHILAGFSLPSIRATSELLVLHDIETSVVQSDIEKFVRYRLSLISETRCGPAMPKLLH
jgi:hypothetical protein